MVLPVGADFASGDGAPPPPHGKTATALVSVDPNPFNPLTHIKFNVGSTSRITLSIYDYRGNLVRELRDEVMPPGPHEVVWDGRDRHGLQVAAGVYLSLLTDGKVRSTQKLVLLK
jgi:flagellar hook assembly protein FlgD